MVSVLDKASLVAVIGAGTMGCGIAQVALNAGHPVLLYDAAEAALARGLAGIRDTYWRLADKGKITPAERDARLSRLAGVSALSALAEAALVIEAIVEDIEIKAGVLARVEAQLGPQSIIATNTSSLSITAIAARLARPQRLVGMHFFNPAPVLPLVEVVRGKLTSPEVLELVFNTARAWKKIPVHCASTPGFIVNRVARPFYGEALRLLAEGTGDAATIDAVLRECGGFRMGAFEVMDLIGHDVNYAVTASVCGALYNDTRHTPSLLQKALVEAGWLGRKSGRGFYDYDPGAVPAPLPLLGPGPAPARVVIEGELGPAAALALLAGQAGIEVQRTAGSGLLRLGDVAIALTDGRSCTERAASTDAVEVCFDLAGDYAAATLIALARADQAPPAALAVAAGFFQALGKRVVQIDDAPGMVVMRTVAMLANEAADCVQQSVASAGAVDLAMQHGVNYPRGPLAWADAIGVARLCGVVGHLAGGYGEDRYRLAPLLRRMAFTGRSFFAGGPA